MATLSLKTPAGAEAGTVELPADVFGVQPNVPLMHQVVTAQLAARRAGTQSTKTRSEVAGGGSKPYRQKGTGNARQGSIRAPQFSGGGIALGPKPRSYRQRTNKKMIKLALRSALSDRANEGKVVVVDGWGFDAPKTSQAKQALAALGLEGRVLVVLDRVRPQRLSQLPQPAERAGDRRRRAQRLRRAVQRRGGVHRRDPSDAASPSSRQRRRHETSHPSGAQVVLTYVPKPFILFPQSWNRTRKESFSSLC